MRATYSQLTRRQAEKNSHQMNQQIAKKSEFLTNCFQINFSPEHTIHIYHLQVTPQILKEDQRKWAAIASTIKKHTQTTLSIVAFNKDTAWAEKCSQDLIIIPCEIKSKVQESVKIDTYEVKISLTSSQKTHGLKLDKQNQPLFNKLIHSKLKQICQSDSMIASGKGRYFYETTLSAEDDQTNMHGYRGFTFTTTQIFDLAKLYLRITPIERHIQSSTFLEVLQKDNTLHNKQIITLKYQGCWVIEKYGQERLFQIHHIDFKLNANSEFIKNGTAITYAQYFQEKYGIKIRSEKQPLINVKVKSHSQKENSIYLLPEWVSLTSKNHPQFKNNTILQNSAKSINRIDPEEWFEEINKFKNKFNEMSSKQNNQFKINASFQVKGEELQCPEVRLYDNSVLDFERTDKTKNCSFSFRERIRNPVQLSDWMVVYSESSEAYIHNFVEKCISIGKVYGIICKERPALRFIKKQEEERVEHWKQQIKDAVGNNPPQIVVIALHSAEQHKLYSELKSFCCNELYAVTQFLKIDKLLESKKINSSITHLMFQINIKCGHSIWDTTCKSPFWAHKDIAEAGISIRQLDGKYYIAMVGRLANSSHVSSSAKIISKTQNITEFGLFFKQWIKEYFIKSAKLPNTIVIYRDSSCGLDEAVFRQEIDIARDSIKGYIRQQSKQLNYQPSLIYVTCNKFSPMKFFDFDNNKMKNPGTGSVVFESSQVKDCRQFWIIPNSPLQGTSTTTHFKIMYYKQENQSKEEEDLKPEIIKAISQLAFESSFNYPNYTGPTPLPAALQCSLKLLELATNLKHSITKRTEKMNSAIKANMDMFFRSFYFL